MTRCLVMSIALVLVFTGSAFSQHGAQIFGGYSYQRTGGEGVNGFNASVTGNIAPWVGITGDFALHSKGTSVLEPNSGTLFNADAKLLSFMFGPQFTSHVNDATSMFVHILAGGYRASGSVASLGPVSALTAPALDFRLPLAVALTFAWLPGSLCAQSKSTGSIWVTPLSLVLTWEAVTDSGIPEAS